MTMAHLSFDGCDAVALAKEYGTPLYVVSERMIRERLRELREDFLGRYPNTYALYASKALQTLDVLRIVASEGIGLDVVSGGELFAASKAGFRWTGSISTATPRPTPRSGWPSSTASAGSSSTTCTSSRR